MSKKKKKNKSGKFNVPLSGAYSVSASLWHMDSAGTTSKITLPPGVTVSFPPEIFKCSTCKKEKKLDRVGFKYWGPKLERVICKTCYAKRMDKLFATKMNADLEETLYEN